MTQDGPRLTKLKEVFKRAIQEILKEENNANNLMNINSAKDSFYSDSTIQVGPETIKSVFIEIKSKFTEIFKNKIRNANLDTKLNNLDNDIKENRVNTKDIKNELYIKEIFESHAVDMKEELIRLLEMEIKEPEQEIIDLEKEIKQIENDIKIKESENEAFEKVYNDLVDEMESIFKE